MHIAPIHIVLPMKKDSCCCYLVEFTTFVWILCSRPWQAGLQILKNSHSKQRKATDLLSLRAKTLLFHLAKSQCFDPSDLKARAGVKLRIIKQSKAPLWRTWKLKYCRSSKRSNLHHRRWSLRLQLRRQKVNQALRHRNPYEAWRKRCVTSNSCFHAHRHCHLFLTEYAN